MFSVNVWRGLWSLQSHYFLPGLQQVPSKKAPKGFPCHLFPQDENYLVSHILGLAALSLLKVSNTIGNDNIVKVSSNLCPMPLASGQWPVFSQSTFFQDCEAEEVAPIQYWSKVKGSSGRKGEGQEEMVPIVE